MTAPPTTRHRCWSRFAAEPRIEVITHPRTIAARPRALRTAFLAASDRGFTHAVTIDSDGQANVSDIPQMVEAAEKAPMALVIGTRDDTAGDYPARSRTGRRVSNFLVLIESGSARVRTASGAASACIRCRLVTAAPLRRRAVWISKLKSSPARVGRAGRSVKCRCRANMRRPTSTSATSGRGSIPSALPGCTPSSSAGRLRPWPCR